MPRFLAFSSLSRIYLRVEDNWLRWIQASNVHEVLGTIVAVYLTLLEYRSGQCLGVSSLRAPSVQGVYSTVSSVKWGWTPLELGTGIMISICVMPDVPPPLFAKSRRRRITSTACMHIMAGLGKLSRDVAHRSSLAFLFIPFTWMRLLT